MSHLRSGWFRLSSIDTETRQSTSYGPPLLDRHLVIDDPSEPATQLARAPLEGIAGPLSRVFGTIVLVTIVASGLFLYRGYAREPSAPSRSAEPVAPTALAAEAITASPPAPASTGSAVLPSSDVADSPSPKPRRKSKGAKGAAGAADSPAAVTTARNAKTPPVVLVPVPKPLSRSATGPVSRSPARSLQ